MVGERTAGGQVREVQQGWAGQGVAWVGSGVAGEGVVEGQHQGGNGPRGAGAEGGPQVGPEGQCGQLLGGKVGVGGYAEQTWWFDLSGQAQVH